MAAKLVPDTVALRSEQTKMNLLFSTLLLLFHLI